MAEDEDWPNDAVVGRLGYAAMTSDSGRCLRLAEVLADEKSNFDSSRIFDFETDLISFTD